MDEHGKRPRKESPHLLWVFMQSSHLGGAFLATPLNIASHTIPVLPYTPALICFPISLTSMSCIYLVCGLCLQKNVNSTRAGVCGVYMYTSSLLHSHYLVECTPVSIFNSLAWGYRTWKFWLMELENLVGNYESN